MHSWPAFKGRSHWKPRFALSNVHCSSGIPSLGALLFDKVFHILANLPRTLIKHFNAVKWNLQLTRVKFSISQYTINSFGWVTSHSVREVFLSNHPEWKSFEFQADVHCTISCTSAWRSGFILGVTAVWSSPTYLKVKKDERPAVSGNILYKTLASSCLFSQNTFLCLLLVSPCVHLTL